MTEQAARVVLLVRPGPARERLVEALAEIESTPVLVADPTQATLDDVREAAPQAVLVVLDAAAEDALERFDPVLSDPDVTVIYDEAELVAQRSAWDHARWLRHLRAKLNRHEDVLPPGGERDADWHPLPGRLQGASAAAGELDLSPFAGEAQERAQALPSDGVRYLHDAPSDAHVQTDAQVQTGAHVPSPEADADPTALDALDMEWTATGAGTEPSTTSLDLAADEFPIDVSIGMAEPATDTVSFDIDGMSAEDIAALEDLSLDEGGDNIEALSFDDVDSPAVDGGEDATTPAARLFDALELVDTDAAIDAPSGVERNPGFVRDLDELDRAVAGIALADVDTYGHGPARGAVLVEAGLGGPDAVRQLLGDVPAGFPRPLLVRLRLDGGRYDKLVKQMQRATPLDVLLAEDGQVAEAGRVYFMPPALGIERQAANLVFVDAAGPQALLDALPPADSAVLFLSGSERAFVDLAMQPAWSGALVAGQAPEGCYDAMASTDVIARGGPSGSPSELAAQLAARWPS